MIRNTCYRAIIVHHCSRCNSRIEKGQLYLHSVASPDHDDLGNPNWWGLDECLSCAVTYGRGSYFLDYMLKHRKGQDATT